jgi:16S rRNA processing protein RimM
MTDLSMLTVGQIVRPHGNKGHVVVVPETDFGVARFAPGATLRSVQDGEPTVLRVVASREHQGRWIVGFEGVTSIDAAERLRGLELQIPAEDATRLGPGGFYPHELVGCAVTTVEGTRVGQVESVHFGAGVPLLAIQTGRGEVLVPLAEEICRSIDVAGKAIVIEPPEGLLEVNK